MQVKKMLAAILVENHEPLVVDEVELPDKLDFGQVLVKVHYSGICASQIHEIDARKGPDNFLPHLLGHEGVGTVLERGAGVRTVKCGDKVCLHWRPGNGLQSETPHYWWNGQKVNAGWLTTFNEYAVVSENRLTAVPQDLDSRIVPLFGCSVTTAMGVINNDAHVKIGQSVVVFGIGGVGLNLLQFASMVAAHPIVGIDVIDAKLDLGRRFGATACLNSLEVGDLHHSILDIVGPNGADVVIDTTGNPRVIEQAYAMTHPNGKTVLVGVPKIGDNISIYTLPLHFNKILTGSHGGSCEPDRDIPRLINLYAAGKIEFEGLITHEYGLGAINEAISLVRTGNTGRVLVKM